MMLSLIFILSVRFQWREMRGSLFLDPSQLASTEGRIVESRLDFVDLRRGTDSWHYVIIYEFTVGDYLFRSDGVTFGPTGDADPVFANDYIAKYPVGRAVTVFYDPENPTFSVLEPATRRDYLLFWLLLSTISGLFGAISAIIFEIRDRSFLWVTKRRGEDTGDAT